MVVLTRKGRGGGAVVRWDMAQALMAPALGCDYSYSESPIVRLSLTIFMIQRGVSGDFPGRGISVGR